MDLLLIFIVSICIFLGWFYTKFRETLKLASKLPGPPKLPILGDALLLAGQSPSQLMETFTDIAAKYPRIACIMLGPQCEVLIADPKLAEVFLSSQKLITKSDEYDFFTAWIGTGLLTSTGRKWFARRKVITPAFHFKILDQFVDIFDKHTDIFIDILKKSNGKPLDVFQPVTLCALDNICGEILNS